MSRLMSAIENISDTHIKEFAFVQIPKKGIPLWVKIGSMVASLVLITLTITTIIGILPLITERNYGARVEVFFNDRVYVIAPNNYATSELPEGYVLVGAISSNDESDSKTNGYASGCKVGENIYQDPSNPDDMFVYTKLFSGYGEYRYIKFVDLSKNFLRG